MSYYRPRSFQAGRENPYFQSRWFSPYDAYPHDFSMAKFYHHPAPYDSGHEDNGYDDAGESRPEKIWSEKDIIQWARNRPDAYVVVYAQWCGACKNLKDELGLERNTLIKPNQRFPNVLFIEEQEKDESVPATHFPFVRHFQRGSDTGETDHGRLVENLLHFVHNK